MMDIYNLRVLFLVFFTFLFNTSAHSASSSSALASSIKFKNPKLDKDKNLNSRKTLHGIDNEFDSDDDGSKFRIVFLQVLTSSFVGQSFQQRLIMRSNDLSEFILFNVNREIIIYSD